MPGQAERFLWLGCGPPTAQKVGSGRRPGTHNDTVTNVGKVSPPSQEPV
jgi:hypothetical protein